MNPVISPTEVVKIAADSGLSPSVQMILMIVGLLMVLAAPAMMFLRDWKKTGKIDDAQGKAGEIQTGLYSHLFEQVSILTKRTDDMTREQSAFIKENAELKARVAALEACEELVKRLQVKLDKKDDMIIARDTQLNVLFADLRLRDQKIIELQERVNVLEVFHAQQQPHPQLQP